MNKLTTSLAIAVFAIGSVTAGDFTPKTMTNAEMDAIKAQIQEQINTQLKDLGDQVQTQLAEAKKAAEKAKLEIKALKMQGKSAEEIEAAMEQAKTQLRTQLQTAIQKMDNCSDEVKAKVVEAQEQIQKKLQERKSDMEALKVKAKENIKLKK